MTRQDHFYPCLRKTLAEIIDTCVSTVILGRDKKYQDRVDFITKSIHNLVEYESKRNPILREKLSKITTVVDNDNGNSLKNRGNRIHDIKVRNK